MMVRFLVTSGPSFVFLLITCITLSISLSNCDFMAFAPAVCMKSCGKFGEVGSIGPIARSMLNSRENLGDTGCEAVHCGRILGEPVIGLSGALGSSRSILRMAVWTVF